MMAGQPPLAGTRVVVFAGLGPVPYAAMLLADLGCLVTVVDRLEPVSSSMPADVDPRRRGQRSIAVDLRAQAGRTVGEALVSAADVVIEGMRPGVMERLGLGPVRCQEINPRVVFARITGWGQDGPYAQCAGHDINYVGLTGALLAMGEAGSPPPVPLNLLGDYAGGSMFAVVGVLAALIERERSGCGQVVDAAIVDGVASLCTATIGMRNAGLWGGRGEAPFDGSRPWYRTYETADAGYVAVGAIEPRFYEALLTGLGLDPADWPRQTPDDQHRLGARLEDTFRSRKRDEWAEVFAHSDACVTPVLSFEEAVQHPQAVARATFVVSSGQAQPAPAPKLSRTPGGIGGEPVAAGSDTDAVLAELGLADSEIETLRRQGVVL
jgi:alpha-methylacyl-CoA racemase